MVLSLPQDQYQTRSIDAFKQHMKQQWLQGEHIALLGPTGTGKTTVASDLIPLRAYAVVLAVKRYDDTLKLYKQKGFSIVKKWPPAYNKKHVILWAKPDSLENYLEQVDVIRKALESIYVSGGWCVYFDEAGYIAGHLGLSTQLGILLNQGRSSHISVVCSMTRPHSMVARIPAETLNQCKHILVFKYTDEREIKSCAEICGMSFKTMVGIQHALDTHDFLYIGKGSTFIVRNTRG